MLLALGLRLYRLDAQSLWNDEGTSVALAQRDPITIARHASYDIHPPLYYLLLHGWVALVGTGEVAVRSLSVVAGVALVAGVWALARRLVGPAAAALAALLAAVAPLQVYYAQETRMYAWAALFGLLATLAFERLLATAPPAAGDVGAPPLPSSRAPARERDSHNSAPSAALAAVSAAARRRREIRIWPWRSAPTVAYALAAVAAIYSHYLGATVLAAHNLAFLAWWAWRWRSRPLAPRSGRTHLCGDEGWGRGETWRLLGAWAALQGLIALSFLPWLAVAWPSLRHWPAVSAEFSVSAMLGDALRVLVWGLFAAERRSVTAVALGVAALALPAILEVLRSGEPEQVGKVPRCARDDGGAPRSPAAGDGGREARSLAGARDDGGAPRSPAAGDGGRETRSLAALGTTESSWQRSAGAAQELGAADGSGCSWKPSKFLGLHLTPQASSTTRDDKGGEVYALPLWFGACLPALYLATPIALMALASLSRPMYKTKFVLLASPPLYILVAAGTIVLATWAARWSRRRGVGVAVAGLLALGALAPAAHGLARMYWDASTHRDDYRGIAAYIAATAGPNDAILINAPSQIETFAYYYQGPLPEYPLPRQRPMDPADAQAELEAMAARHERIWAVLWATDESDPQRVIEGWLDAHAFKAMDRWFGNVRLAMYALPRSWEGVAVAPAGHVLGDVVRLTGYSVLTPAPSGGDVLQVALHWEALAPMATRYKVFVHLVGPEGAIVAQRDSEPGGGARLTNEWAPGDTLADLYGLLIPPDTPPGEHLLRVGMYHLDGGQRLPVTLDGHHLGDAIDLVRVYVRGDQPQRTQSAEQTE